MNVQRYVSTVYTELVYDKEYNQQLSKILHSIDNTQSEEDSYYKLRRIYTEEEKGYDGNGILQFLLHDLFFEKIFGNNLNRLYKYKKNTLFLFPVFKEKQNDSRLNPILKNIYSKLKQEPQEFVRDKETGNMYLFIPAFSEDEEPNEEYNERLKAYLDRAFEFIQDQKPKRINNVIENKTKFESICYTVDKEGSVFTGYYKKKLLSGKVKLLTNLVERFVEKLDGKLFSVTDPITKLTKEESRKKIKERVKEETGPIDSKLFDKFDTLIDVFVDVYKKTNDREYLRLASSSDNQSYYRIFYRVHNTDLEDTFDVVKAGSTYVYHLEINNTHRFGYFKERKGTTNQFIFREYTGITAEYNKAHDLHNKDKSKPKPEIKSDTVEEEESSDFKEEKAPREYVIETKRTGNIIRFKEVKQSDYSNNYPGTVKLAMDLHIYEKYKWFQFNELDGTLSPETKIKYYKNIRFDRKSFVEYLKTKKDYNDKMRVAVEFLKVNQNNTLLMEYVNYILSHKKDTHVFKESIFSGNIYTFVEKTKKEMTDLLFRTNELIYLTSRHSEQTKADIKKNYKIISHQYFKVDKKNINESTRKKEKEAVQHFFDREIFEDIEKKYCKRSTCELIAEMDKYIENTDYGIAIVDVTKENIEVVSDLKAKTKCKRLRKTLRKQLQPFLEMFMPRFGGTRRKSTQPLRKRSRPLRTRRKNRH